MPDDAFLKMQTLILGAGESIELIAPTAAGLVASPDLLAMVDGRIRLRCILGPPWPLRSMPDKPVGAARARLERSIESFGRYGWQMRLLDGRPAMQFIVVDGRDAMVFPLNPERGAPPGPAVHYGTGEFISRLAVEFERAWQTSRPVDRVYDDEALGLTDRPEQRIVIASAEVWTELIAQLSRIRVRSLPCRRANSRNSWPNCWRGTGYA